MITLRKKLVQVSVIAVVAFMLAGAQSDKRARYTKLGHEFMCECGCGQILLECNHVGCTVSTKMTEELRAMLDKGSSDEQIKQAFVQEYGTVVLAAPSTKGFDRVAWIMPFVVFALGIGAVVYVVRTWKQRPVMAPTVSAAPPAEMDEMRRRAREDTEV